MEPIPVAEGRSLDGYQPIDSIEQPAPIGHGVTQNFGAQGYDDRDDESLGMRHRGPHKQSLKDRRDESKGMEKSMGRRPYSDVATMDAQGYDDRDDESLGMRHRGPHKQSFKDRRDEAASMDKRHSRKHRKYDDVMTMDSEFSAYPTLQNYSGVDSWVVEAPLGHGAPQFFAEDEPEPHAPPGITGQDGPSNEPTNSHFSADEPEPHAPDGVTGQDGPSNEPTNAHFSADRSITRDKRGRLYARDSKGRIYTHNSETNFPAAASDWDSINPYNPMESIEVDRTSYQPTQDYGADFTLEKPVRTGFMLALGAGLFSLAAISGTVLLGNLMGGKTE